MMDVNGTIGALRTGRPRRHRPSPAPTCRPAPAVRRRTAIQTVTAPASATLGTTGAITLAFSGLTAGTKYLGSVAYGGTSGMPNPTIVRVDP